MDIDLLAMIQQDTRLKRVSSHRGGEWHGPCPFCGGQDRFRVRPNDGPLGFWKCRSGSGDEKCGNGCGRGGDAIAYAVETGRMTTTDAYKARHGDAVNVGASSVAQPSPRLPETCIPPSQEWQQRAWDFVAESQAALWSWQGDGARALAWLMGRGLSEDTITRGGLGYHAGNPEFEDRAAWGLPDELNDKGNPKRVWLPRGVVIPWVIGDDVWRVNIRRPPSELAAIAKYNAGIEARFAAGEISAAQRDDLLKNDAKYIGPTGRSEALYDADQLTTDRPAILVEGELDALTIKQVAGDLITPTATGSTGGSRRARWLAKLALCPRVLVAFDADKAGEDARQYWLEVLPNGKYWRPFWSDANRMQQTGGDLRGWATAGLEV